MPRAFRLRLVAAGKLWASLTGDTEALEIFERRTLDESDRMAATLDRLSGLEASP